MSAQSHSAATNWREKYLGGDEHAEGELIDTWSREIQEIQYKIRAQDHAASLRRGFHAKQHAGVDNAEFVVLDHVPDHLQVGPFQPGARYPAIVRLSNASGATQADQKGDLRGLAARVHVGPDTDVDLLATNGAVSFARDPGQFMAFAKATTGSRLMMLPSLLGSVGLSETVRMLRIAVGDTRRTVMSLATEQYWSRGAYRFGDFAIRFTLVPMADSAPEPAKDDPDYLRHEIVARLRVEPVSWNFMVQLFRDEETTPIEDAATRWGTELVNIARLTIPQQDLTQSGQAAVGDAVDSMEFNPWNTTEELRPLGSINRARLRVYEASQDTRRPR